MNPALVKVAADKVSSQNIDTAVRTTGSTINKAISTYGMILKTGLVLGFSVFIVIVLLIVFSVYRKNKKAKSNLNEAEKEVDKNKLSFKELYYKTLATRLKEAFNYFFGTDEDTIYGYPLKVGQQII